MWANRSGCLPKMSEWANRLLFWANCSFAQKTDERIPSPDLLLPNLLLDGSAWNYYGREYHHTHSNIFWGCSYLEILCNDKVGCTDLGLICLWNEMKWKWNEMKTFISGASRLIRRYTYVFINIGTWSRQNSLRCFNFRWLEFSYKEHIVYVT